MREIYQWTEWFTELAGKIAEGGEAYLIDRVKRVEWNADGTTPPLLHHGDENIDPLSFIYSLASRNAGLESRKRVYRSVEKVFGMTQQFPVDVDDAFIFPKPDPRNLLFQGNPESLWRLLRGAVAGVEYVDAPDFDGVLGIAGVGTAKLTQVLFLVNPSAFLPYDEATRSLSISNMQGTINWQRYQEALQKFRDAFPGCEFCEINLFAYLWKNGELRREGFFYYQLRTGDWGIYGDDLWNGTNPEYEQLYFEPNNWVFAGGPKSGLGWEDYDESRDGSPTYLVRDPRPGDVMLVRTGSTRGCGIGVVYRNDYRDRLAESSRIHVVWVNRVAHDNLQLKGLSKLWELYRKVAKTP